MAGRYHQFRRDLLIAIAKEAETNNGYINPRLAAINAGLLFPGGWAKQASRELEADGFLNCRLYAQLGDSGPDDGIDVTITGEGYDFAESLINSPDATDTAPASDRIVTLDHNSAGYQEARDSLDNTIAAVKGNNELAADDPEDRERQVAELESGRRLLEATRVRVEAVQTVLVSILKRLIAKFTDHAIGKFATLALEKLLLLLDVSG